VLLHEMVLWPQGNQPLATHSDVLMMAAANSKERSEEMWKALVEPVGYKIVKVHTVSTSPQSIVELTLA